MQRTIRSKPSPQKNYGVRIALILILFSSGSGMAQTYGFDGLDWKTCAPGSRVLCATTKVPLDWNDAVGPQIDYFVRRYPAPIQPASRSVVYVAGGPGSTGSGGASLAQLQASLPDLDVIAPDHRGTGRSTWFGCNQSRRRSQGSRQLQNDVFCECDVVRLESLYDAAFR